MGKSDLGVTRCGRITSAVRDRFPGDRSSAIRDGDSEVAGFEAGAKHSSQLFGVKNELSCRRGSRRFIHADAVSP